MRERAPLPLLLLASCAVPEYAPPPALDLPEMATPAEDLTHWWQRFADADLDALMTRVLAHNTDLRVAAARVDEAAALVRNADDLLPEMSAFATAGRKQTSDRNAFPRFAGIDREYSEHSIGLAATWELDLWGRIRAGTDAALSDLLLTQQDRHGLQASLTAQAAQAYFRLVAIDRHLALAETTLTNRRDALRIEQRRRQAGTGSALEEHQAAAEMESVAATLPRLRAAQHSAVRALLVLAGDEPLAMAVGALPRAADLPTPPPVPAGLPSDLLARRPDIRAAEAALAGESARVAEARARYFPTIRLTGTFGQESEDLANLFTSPATIWNLAGSLVQPIFGLRKIDAQYDAAVARRVAAEAQYVRTVQTAFAEAYDSLEARSSSRETLEALARQIAALRQAERVAEARHLAGAGTYLDLLTARRGLLTVQGESIDTAAEELAATIDVYRALGGGWTPD